jgi:tetratricopeptide (TPR) repeat protein
MKNIITIVLLSLFLTKIFSQSQDSSNLLHTLSVTEADSTRSRILNRLSKLYLLSKPDSSMLLAKQGLKLARLAEWPAGEAECLNSIGNAFYVAGNYPNALEAYLQTLKIYEKLNNPKGMGVSFANIALINVEQGDYRQALVYHFKTNEIFKKSPGDPRLLLNLLNIGDTYEKLGMLDSALYFTMKGYNLAKKQNDSNYRGMALNNLGNIYERFGKSGMALKYYRQSIPYSLSIDDKYCFGETYLAMAKLFEKAGQYDSCYYYAKLALEAGRSISGYKFIKNAAEFLARNYEKRGMSDSAFFYFKTAVASKDSLFSEEKVRQVQALKFNEQLRQQEIAELKMKAEEKRKNNLQLSGIAVFIAAFGMFVILMSRKKTKSRLVEFMALLGLLLLFEFITLFIDPFIGKWTHHTPVFMLILSVSLAAILVPSHHFLVKVVKQKLAHKITLPQGHHG